MPSILGCLEDPEGSCLLCLSLLIPVRPLRRGAWLESKQPVSSVSNPKRPLPESNRPYPVSVSGKEACHPKKTELLVDWLAVKELNSSYHTMDI